MDLASSSGEGPYVPVRLRRNVSYLLLLASSTLISLSSGLTIFASPLIVLYTTHSAGLAGLVGTGLGAGTLVTLLPAGVLADRLNRKSMMVASSTAVIIALSAATVSVMSGASVAPCLTAAAVVLGAGLASYLPVEHSMLREVVDKSQLPLVLSVNQGRSFAATLVAMPLGGLLLQLGWMVPAAVGGCCAVGALCCCLALPSDSGRVVIGSLDLHHALAGIRFIVRRADLRSITFIGAFVNIGFPALTFGIVLSLVNGGLAPSLLGVLQAGGSVGGLVGSVLAGSVTSRWPTGRLCLGALGALILLGWGMSSVSGNWWAVMIAMFLANVIVLIPNIGLDSYEMAVTPQSLQGRVGSASSFISSGLSPVGPALGGWTVAMVSFPLAGSLLLLPLAGLVLGLLTRGVRTIPRPSEWAIDEASADELAGQS